MIKVSSNGFVIIEEKVQPFDKSGLLKLVILIYILSMVCILC